MSDLTYVDFLTMFVNHATPGTSNEIKTYTFTPAPIFVNVYRAYRNYADWLNATRPHRKISWRRLNRQQKVAAIMNEVYRAYHDRPTPSD